MVGKLGGIFTCPHPTSCQGDGDLEEGRPNFLCRNLVPNSRESKADIIC